MHLLAVLAAVRGCAMTPTEADRITWVDSHTTGAKYTAAELIARAEREGATRIGSAGRELAGQFRYVPPAPDPSPEAVPLTPEQLELHRLDAREKWRHDAIGSRVMSGLHLLGLPWGPSPESLIAALVSFALQSLYRIDALAKQLRAAVDKVADRDRELLTVGRAAAEAKDLAAREAAKASEAIDSLRDQLAETRAQLAVAQQDLTDTRRDRDAAIGTGEAWRSAAESSADALAVLRAALKIPTEGSGSELVRR